MRFRLPIVAVLVMSGACSGGDDTDVADDDSAPVRSITVPPERLTPFCQAMIDLDEALPADPSIDNSARILEAYRDALPDAPAEIAVQFAAVVDALERGTEATLPATTAPVDGSDASTTPPGTTTAPTPASTTPPAPPPTPGGSAPSTFATENTFDEEGYLPDESPAAQVNAYIDFVCRGVANNPGPPPTEPDAPIVTDGT